MPTEDLIDDEQPLEAPKQSAGSSVLAGLAFFAALAALALTVLMWWQDSGTEPGPDVELAQRVDELGRTVDRQAQALAQLDRRVDQVEARPQAADDTGVTTQLAESNRALQQQLESQQTYTSSLQQAIEALQARLLVAESNIAAASPARTDLPASLDLAGVEYLLRLAPERLALFYDVDSADQALAMADARLAAMDNPLYLGLRQHISEARRSLADFDLPNSVEISATIDTLQQAVSSLVFAGEGSVQADTPNTDPTSADAGWWTRLKASLASLVTVRRSAADDVSRLSLEDKDMLRQGLWMQLEEARLALARHDPEGWQAAIGRVERVLQRWFEPSGTAFATMKDGLNELASVEISPDVPDISGPWSQLQMLRRTQAIPPATPVPAAPDPEPVSPEPAPTEPDSPAPELAEPTPESSAAEAEVEADEDGADDQAAAETEAEPGEGVSPEEGQGEEDS